MVYNINLRGVILFPVFYAAAVIFISCSGNSSNNKNNTPNSISNKPGTTRAADTVAAIPAADPPAVTGEVPVLCYHQIRDWKSTDSKSAKTYILPVAAFKEQIKALHDSGYHTILPDELLAHLKTGAKLPSHPVMLTFDDADESQYSVGLPELDKAGFKGVFFIMTVVLGHPNYMTRKEVADLDSKGQVIGCHTWNHTSVTKYNEKDWITQLEKPTAELAKITGKPCIYFAYPNGLWNSAAIPQLKKNGYAAAFRLWGKDDPNDPVFTLERILVSGYWGNKEMFKAVHNMERKEQKQIANK